MSDTPISEDDLARMFEEDDSPEVIPPAPNDPEPEPEPEPVTEPQVVPAEQPATETPAQEAPTVTPVTEQPSFAEGEEHLEWASRRNLSTFEETAKLAYEQEKFLGHRAAQVKELEEQIELLESTGPEPAPVGRTDEWIQQALVSPDPARYAMELAQSGDWGTYQRMMETWEGVVGETVTVNVHQQIMAMLEANAPEPATQNGSDPQRAIREAFAVAGVYDMLSDPVMPQVRKVADELGASHALVQGAARGDAVAVQGLVEIARARTLTTRTLRVTAPDPARPELTGDGGSPSRTPPAASPFAEMDEEWRRMGALPAE